MRIKKIIILCLWFLAGGLAFWLLFGYGSVNVTLQLSNTGDFNNSKLTGTVGTVSASTVLISPRFTGQNNKGQMWDLQAAHASRTGNVGEDVVVLFKVKAKFSDNLSTKKYVTFTANKGQFYSSKDTLILNDKVIVNGYGLQLKAPKLTANVKTQDLTANQNVVIIGQGNSWRGNIKASNLSLTNNGNRLRLTGGVVGKFYSFNHNKQVGEKL